jgi:hypothetical protein
VLVVVQKGTEEQMVKMWMVPEDEG